MREALWGWEGQRQCPSPPLFYPGPQGLFSATSSFPPAVSPCVPGPHGPPLARPARQPAQHEGGNSGGQGPSICTQQRAFGVRGDCLLPWSAAPLWLVWLLRSSARLLPAECCMAPVGVAAVAVAHSPGRERGPSAGPAAPVHLAAPPHPVRLPYTRRTPRSVLRAVLEAPPDVSRQQLQLLRAGTPGLTLCTVTQGAGLPLRPWGPQTVCSPLPLHLSLTPSLPCNEHHLAWPW